MQNFGYILVPSVIAVLIYLGINAVDSVSNTNRNDSPSIALDYDGYAEGISTRLFNEFGQIDYTLEASKQIHYLNEVTVLEFPQIELFQEGTSRWNIVAISGRITAPTEDSQSSIEKIELNGSVEVSGIDSYGNKTTFSTEKLLIDPNQETLETDQLVSMVSEGISQTSIGMFADLNQNRILFHSNVRGTYANPAN